MVNNNNNIISNEGGLTVDPSMKMNLSVSVGELKLKNPIILASCGLGAHSKTIKKFIEKGFGAIVTKTVTKEPKEGAPLPRIFWYDPKEKNLLSGAEGLRNPGIERMSEIISECKPLAKRERCLIIGSVTEQSVEEMGEMASALVKAGADAIELNFACPNVGPHIGPSYDKLGKYWSKDSMRAQKAIQYIKNKVNVPVGVKFPIITLVQPSFLADIEKAKPNYCSFSGGKMPCLVIDTETGNPKFSGSIQLQIQQKKPILPSITGPVKPMTILHAAYLSKLANIPITPAGGIRRGTDVIEALMVGASAVQICTAVYRDMEVNTKILKEISDFMKKKQIKSLLEIKGISLKHIPNPPLLQVPGVQKN